MTSLHKIRKFYYAIAMIVFSLISAYMLINDDNQTMMGSQRTFLARSILCLVWSICSLWYFKDIYIHPISSKENPFRHNIIKWLSAFTIGVCISIIMTHMDTFKELCSSLLSFIAPFLILLGSYIIARHYGKENFCWMPVVLLFISCMLAYMVIYKTYNILGEQGRFYSAYYFLFIFPLLLLCNNKWVQYISLFLTIILVLSSIKRAGTIALCMGLFTYISISSKDKTSSFTRYLYLLFTALFVGIIVYYTGSDVIERFVNTDDTTGSGRTDIWMSLLPFLKSQDITNWIVGNGYYSTMNFSWRNFSAHNDFLEVLFDYGIINLFFYVLFFLSSFHYAIHLIKQKSRYAASFSATIVMLFILSMLSIIISKHIQCILFLTLGLLIGWNEHEKHPQTTL